MTLKHGSAPAAGCVVDQKPVASGMISQYNLQPHEMYPIRNLINIVSKRIKMQGFIVTDPAMGPKYEKDHREKLQEWIADGTFKVTIDTTKGIDNAVKGFLGMLKGENFGKVMLELEPLEQGTVSTFWLS